MNLGRLWLVAWQDLRQSFRRPLFWFLVIVVGLTLYGLSAGNVRIASGDSQVGGTKAWITSEFAVAQITSFLIVLLYAFFVAVAAGMAIIQDEEHRLGPILHATPLKPAEYFYGKFLGVMTAFLAVLGLHVLLSILFNHGLPSDVADEVRGPFSFAHYLRPILAFGLPTLFFLGSTAFAVGAVTRKPILVFVLPVAVVLVCGFFLWNWAPTWLAPEWNRLLMVLDPGGFRWLNETWLKVDRGVRFYNTAPVGFDGLFWWNRGWMIVVGLLSLVLAERGFARSLRGEAAPRGRKAKAPKCVAGAGTASAAPVPELEEAGAAGPLLGRLAMAARRPGFIGGLTAVVRAEFRELGSQPGLYLFVPIILLQVLGNGLTAVGAFDTPLLATPGTTAVATFNTLTLLVCLLLLFYSVESLERDRASGLDPIVRATPISTVSLLLGKALANALVAVVILLATLLASWIVMLIQGKVAFSIEPFLTVWGLFLIPTFVLWTTFVMALHSMSRNRYLTYALAMAALIFTGVRQMTGKMNWVGNWDLWAVLQWSDMGRFELNGTALLWNRIMAAGLVALFVALTLRFYLRHESDASRIGHRLMPGALLRAALPLLPFLVVPLTAGTILYFQVFNGFQGKAMEKKTKDYWRRNLATWRDTENPDILHVDLDVAFEPRERTFRTSGTYRLVNRTEKSMRHVALTGNVTWEEISWTVNGDSAAPDDRLKLFVFTPEAPLAPGDTIDVGFRFRGAWPTGITKNGGGTGEFVLPSGVVLTSFDPTFAPVVGYQERIGIDRDNRYDSKEYPDDFHVGRTKGGLGSLAPFTTRIRVTGPAEYRWNSVGALESDVTEGDRRTMTWTSDHPVNFFNVVAGRWAEKRGESTVIYYHPEHHYNIEEMSEALDAARKYFSEWFYPYPWRDLKLSEFPGLRAYAQGFATNITFSEQIGFLTKSDPRANLAFMVTAHEAAHQWWGNIILPGEGPGGNILSEGTAHFSTMLLFDRVKGPEQRIEFAKRIESRYGERRQVDSERPLVKIDDTKDGDQTVTYDKGGWVFWMLLNHMGRDSCLAGIREFMQRYDDNRDHPVLQDFTAVLREFAADTTAYDAFVGQWFHDVVVPEYRFTEATKSRAGADSAWTVSVIVTNQGSGEMPVEVAAVRGERFPKPEEAGKKPWREMRAATRLSAGQSDTLTIACPFEPEEVLVDPDALVLQLNRKNAVTKLEVR
jgi:ABC-2 type transport system permease protein